MVDTVILHCPGDESLAQGLARTWTARRSFPCTVDPGAERLAFGSGIFRVGVWGDAASLEEGGALLLRLLAETPARSLLVVWDDDRIPEEARGRFPILVAPKEPDAALAALTDAVRQVSAQQVAPPRPTPPPPETPIEAAVAPIEQQSLQEASARAPDPISSHSAPPPRAAPAATLEPDPAVIAAAEAELAEAQAARRAHWRGFALGSAIGALLMLGGFAFWASRPHALGGAPAPSELEASAMKGEAPLAEGRRTAPSSPALTDPALLPRRAGDSLVPAQEASAKIVAPAVR